MDITFTGRFASGFDIVDIGIRDMATVVAEGRVHLFTATAPGGGLASFRAVETGLPQLRDVERFVWTDTQAGAGTLGMQDGADGLRLTFAGAALRGFDIDGADRMIPDGRVPGLGAGPVRAMLDARPGESAIHFADAGGLGVQAAGGTVLRLAARGPDGPVEMPGAITAMEWAARPGGGTPIHALTLDSSTQGVASWRLGAAGSTAVLSGEIGAADGLGIGGAHDIAAVAAHGASWAIVAGSGSNSLSVLSVASDGALSATDHLLDTRETRFGAVQAVEAMALPNGGALVVAGGGDDGLSLFSLLPDGRLAHLRSIAHDFGLGLDGVNAIETADLGGRFQVFVASQTATGLSQFDIDLARIGAVRGGLAATGTIAGTGRDDMITGSGRLEGRGGDDILVAGAAATDMLGGSGRDLFVINGAAPRARILDFEPGRDRIDLSDWPMMRGPDQLTEMALPHGIRLGYRDMELRVLSRDGGPLALGDLFGHRFETPDRILVLGNLSAAPLPPLAPTAPTGPLPTGPLPGEPTVAGPVSGGTGGETGGGTAGGTGEGTAGDTVGDSVPGTGPEPVTRIFGTPGADRLTGSAQGEEIWAMRGPDHVDGAGGHDTLGGGYGNDTIRGGDGRDIVFGNDGADLITGGSGADRLWGGPAADTIEGGTGADTMAGNGGADRIFAGGGTDLVFGTGGWNRIFGGTGGDTLWGGSEPDRLNGEGGDDFLGGGARDDTLSGGAGADTLLGNAGNDRLHGGWGPDMLEGQWGADTFVFTRGDGWDRIADFDRTGGDRLLLDPALWSGGADAARLVAAKGGITPWGSAKLAFDGGETLVFDGIDHLDGLAAHIDFL